MPETLRLRALSQFIDLDIENDRELQEIADLASVTCGVPIAVITFLDAETLYIKVKKGIEGAELPRANSFCNYTISTNEVMVVENALTDQRFTDSLLVSGPPAIRFYAGMPLITSQNQNIGTLCVMDTCTHQLSDQQLTMLKILAHQVTKVLELMTRVKELEKHEIEVQEQRIFIEDATNRLRSFFESSTNFHVLLGKSGELIDFNRTAYDFVQSVHKAELKRGELFISYVAPAFVSTFIDKYNLALEGKKSIEEGSTDYGEMGVIWWDATFDPARDKDNQIIGISYIIRNVTDRKLREQKILEQNTSLMQIAHIQTHEFRGPLTTIMGLMNLIKEENYDAPMAYYQYLEQAIDKLDDKIKAIVTNIEGNVAAHQGKFTR